MKFIFNKYLSQRFIGDQLNIGRQSGHYVEFDASLIEFDNIVNKLEGMLDGVSDEDKNEGEADKLISFVPCLSNLSLSTNQQELTLFDYLVFTFLHYIKLTSEFSDDCPFNKLLDEKKKLKKFYDVF